MPLKRGSSKATIAANIRELHTGKVFARTARKHGKETANKQAIAIAMRMAGKSRPRKRTIAEGG